MQVSSVSNFHPDTGGGGRHLLGSCVQFPQGERTTANKPHWRVWGARGLWATLGLPHSRRVCCPGLHCSGSRLSAGDLSKAGPGLHALPRSKLLRFRFSGTPQGHRLDWACVLWPSQVRAARATRSLGSALPQEDCVSYHLPHPSCSVSRVCSGSTVSGGPCVPLGSWSLAVTLLVDANCPGSQEDLVSNWEPAHSLVEDAVSGANIAPCLWLFSHLPAPLPLVWGGASLQLVSSPLVFVQSFVLLAGQAVP